MEDPITERNDLSGRVRDLERGAAVTNERVSTQDKEKDLLWTAVDKLRTKDGEIMEQISNVKIGLAKIMGGYLLIQTIAIALIIHFLSK